MKKITFFLLLALLPLMASAQTDLTGASVSLTQNVYDYDGTAHCPKVSSIRRGTKRYNSLVEGTDYDITYENNVNAGEATATLTFKGDYTGTATRTFTISPKDMNRVYVKMELNETEFAYDGTEKKPVVSDLYYGEKLLVCGIDYDISYENNISPGTATATVTFKGNYTGSKSREFNINLEPGTDIVINGSCGDNVNYSFYNKTGLLSITGTGAIYNYAYTLWKEFEVKTVEISEGVTSIGNSAFYKCSNLTSVTIPNSVTSIGEGVFSDCYVDRDKFVNNSSLDAKKNNYWGATLVDSREDGFYISNYVLVKYVGSESNITIPNSVTSIGEKAFSGCSGLTSLTIPNSVTSIGSYAFGGCFGLTSITVESGNTVYDSRDNCNAIIETASNTLIAGCQNTIIPQSVIIIGESAFSGCKGLTSVTIPNSVTSIGNGAFYSCFGLTSVTIGNSVTSIGYNAFEGCSGLTSVTIPYSVRLIGSSAFRRCSLLKNIYNYSLTPQEISGVFGDIYGVTLHIPQGSKEAYQAANVWKNFDMVEDIFVISGVCGENVDYSFDIRTGVLSITGTGAMYDYVDSSWKKLEVKTAEISEGVTSIGGWAFSGCKGLTSVIIPNSVTSIGYGAFANCSSLTSVTIPNSVTSIGYATFSGCSRLTSVTIPNSVTSIEGVAFSYCSDLASITIPNSVTEIERTAFYNCAGLASILVESGNKVYDSRDNCNAIIETASNTLVSGCQNTVIPYSVTSIGDGAFYGCSGLTSVTIPNSVTSIGGYAFSGCSGLTSISVESGNTVYDSRENCNAIIETASNTLITGCQNSIIPNSVTSIGSSAFSGCSGLTSVTIPNSVTAIGSSAFSGCTGLTSVTIPNSVTSIGGAAFYNCSSLTEVTIPNSVTSIESQTFQNCSSLMEVTIPNSVTSIESYSFSSCSKLTDFYCFAESVPTATFWALRDTPITSATLHVPAASVDAYKTKEPWSGFGTIVELEDTEPTPIIEYVRGDANGDGEIGMPDVMFVVNYILGSPADTFDAKAADANQDGEVGMPDVMFIVNYILNGSFPDKPQIVTVMDLMEENDYSIFLEALKRTGLSSLLLKYKNDKVYTVDNPTDQYGNTLYYPTSRNDGWTVFAEKDDVFRANGINNFEDLKTKCAEWYASPSWYDYVKEKGISISTGTDYENEWNVVHMFVAYHILKAKLPVDRLVYENFANNTNWNVCFGYEPQSYYETMLSGTLLKVWATDVDNSHLNPNLWVNRYVKNNTLTDQYGTFGSDAMHPIIYSGAQIDRASSLGTENCYVHSVDKVLLYDQNVVNSQCERMRFSQNQLLPELANNGILGATPTEIREKDNGGNGNMVAFPWDYFDNLRCYEENMILRYNVLGAWRTYESTQLQGWGNYDFAIKLPPVPTGTYELRMNYCPYARGGVMQFYIGDSSSQSSMIAQGVPLDAGANPTVEGNAMCCERILEEYATDDNGHQYETGSDFGVESDRKMRNCGYMRAPASFSRGTYNNITEKLTYDPSDIYSAAKYIVGSNSCRSEWGYGTMVLRRIICTQKFEQGKDYWLRIKKIVDDEQLGWQFNSIELVPIDVYDNKTYMEDWY